MSLEVNGIFVAAHELKAPLSLMRQLALSLDPADPRQVENYQEKLVSVSERALKQVSDLSKIARLEDGLFALEPVAVRSVCDEVEAELKYLFRFNSRDLDVRYTNRSRLVVANRDLLRSVIYNFCANAVRYSSAESTSRLLVNDAKDKVKITVRDFGPALSSDVFDRLNHDRLDAPVDISFRPDSSGLGLYIATKFARFMHANVGAVRHTDGTSFFVELPVSNQASLFS
ncbi:HAMP domain-containing histidine kinase [Candidatus Saccharibacteria bacterium]|nr:HAMP domain-containing histidine kinase [Candidatus Saccharibacteria bacterium]